MKNKRDRLFFTQLFVPQASQSSYDRRTELEVLFAIPSAQSACGMEISMMDFGSSCCRADNVSGRCSGDSPGCCIQTACPVSGRPACTTQTACRPGASCISRQDIERLLLWKLGLMKCQNNRFCSGWQKRPGACHSDFFFH